MPSISSDTRLILGIVAAAAGIIAGVVGNVLAINIVYFFTRRGRPPTQRPVYIWMLFSLSAMTSITLGSVAAFAPAQLETTGVIPQATPSGSDNEFKYVGRVIDIATQQPIAGAKVTLDLQDVPPIVYTDSEGIYQFKLLINSTVSGKIRVDAQGYETYTRNINLSPGLGKIEDIRLMPVEQPQATVTPSFVGYDFETDTAGWNTSEGDYKRAILSTTTLIAYNGSQALVLDTELYGNGSLEFANHGQEDIYRHTETLVYFNQIPEGIDYPGPYDLTGKRLSCFIYLPVGLIAPNNATPAYVRLILKDKNFANQFSEPVMINNETTEQWLELIYVVNPDSNSDFDITQVNAMGVRLDSLNDSTVSYSGPIYIDYCTIDFR
jgi:hypothetical protein